MIKTPLYRGILQSDLELNGFSAGGGGGGGGGVPVGGTTGQSLTKISNTDFDTHWSTITGGGGAMPGVFKSVKDSPYNAVGNGIADDTVAIQTAINDVFAAGGGTVFFPQGVYLCNGAFDATTNSVLKIPMNAWNTGSARTIRLLGEVPQPWSPNVATVGVFGSILKTTKTGTGTYPAFLAGNTPSTVASTVPLSSFNVTMVYVTNLTFSLPDDPTLGGIRFDSVGWVVVENSVIGTATGAIPTHVNHHGLLMPSNPTLAINYVNHTLVFGFDIGLSSGEYLQAPHVYLALCNVGLQLTKGLTPVTGQIGADRCGTPVKFIDYCVVDFNLGIERNSGVMPWTYDVYDPSGFGTGEIRYVVTDTGTVSPNDLIVNGGSNLSLFNQYLTHWNAVNIGKDLRLVPISGGGKLQARNTSTGLWADVDQWTNP